jgi:hypothetical protein
MVGVAVPIVAGFLIGERWAVLLAVSGIGWDAVVFAKNGLPPLIRHANPLQVGLAAGLTTLFDALLIFCGIALRRAIRRRASRKKPLVMEFPRFR